MSSDIVLDRDSALSSGVGRLNEFATTFVGV